MSREVQASARLSIRDAGQRIDWKTPQRSFSFDLADTYGPTPGVILATVHGTDVDLSAIDVLGWCFFHNLDEVNYVQVGIWDPSAPRFHPFMRLPPTFAWPVLLDEFLQWEFGSGPGTGTGTLGAEDKRLRVRAYNQSCRVRVEAWNGQPTLR